MKICTSADGMVDYKASHETFLNDFEALFKLSDKEKAEKFDSIVEHLQLIYVNSEENGDVYFDADNEIYIAENLHTTLFGHDFYNFFNRIYSS